MKKESKMRMKRGMGCTDIRSKYNGQIEALTVRISSKH